MLSSRLRIILFIAFLSLSWSLIPSKSLRCLRSLHRNCMVPKLDHRQQNPTRPVAISLLASSEVNTDTSINLQPLSRLSPLLKINSLMLFFFATLGSTMPYMPLYYRKIGISGKLRSFNIYHHVCCVYNLVILVFLTRQTRKSVFSARSPLQPPSWCHRYGAPLPTQQV